MVKLICLMPTYNKENTLAKAIESVLMQKTNFKYKLIILDDCSSDNSNKIAKEYQIKYPEKIEVVRNKTNLKLLYSIFNGYKLLKGADYFCVLDADDWYTYDKKFADAVDFLDENKRYSLYMTNITVKKGSNEELAYKGSEKTLSFDFKDRKLGKDLFMQTSGVVYRNVYFKDGKNEEFEKILEYKYPESFRADGFRYEWYLHKGKAYFKNNVESVYNYDLNGIWSSSSECEQMLSNAKMMYSCAKFFKKDEEFYYFKCRQFLKKIMLNIKNENNDFFSKNKEDLSFLFDYTYISSSPKLVKLMKLIIKIMPCKYIRKIYRECF